MLKFASIIAHSGFYIEEFPNASKIPTRIYDNKNREIKNEEVKFCRFLFNDNQSSLRHFYIFLKRIEKKANQIPEITVKIDENSVVVTIPNEPPKFFSRQSFMDLDL